MRRWLTWLAGVWRRLGLGSPRGSPDRGAWSALLDATSHSVLVHDPATGRVVEANPAAQARFGLIPEDIHGLEFDDLWSLEDPETPSSSHRLHRGGRELVMTILAPAEHEPDSRERSWNRAMAQTLTTQLPAVVWTTDRELRFTANGGARLTALGVEPDDLLGIHLTEYFGTDDLDFPAIEAHRRALRGESVHYEMSWRGLRFAARVRPLRTTQDGVHGVVGVALDVTQRHRAEEALAASERKYRELMEHAWDGIFLLDPEGRITEVNPRGCEMLGQSHAELRGQRIDQLRSPDDPRPGVVLPGPEEGSVSMGEHLFEHPEGYPPAPMEFTARRLAGGRILLIARDTTERNLLEEQLRQAQKMEAIGRLTASIAHDFNNLLTAIRGHAELLLAEYHSHQEVGPGVEEISMAAERAATLVRQLMAYSRQQVMKPRVVSLNDVILNMKSLVDRMVREDVIVTLHLAETLAPVKVDPVQIEQVVLNLVTNARDAMPEGGRITMRTAERELDEEYCRTHMGVQPGRYALLTVTDTGHGMSPEIQEQIFEPFFTTKAQGDGTGLGLSTVYGIIRQSGGHVWVYSELDSGTTFKLYFPVVDEVGEADETGEDDPSAGARESGAGSDGRSGAAPGSDGNGPAGYELPAARGETLLVVEDDDAIRSVILRILLRLQYSVLEARDGEEALDLCKDHAGDIDLILSDLILPGVNGIDLVQHIRTLHPGARAALMSGYGHDDIESGELDEVTSVFLEKPFTPHALAEAVRSALKAPLPGPSTSLVPMA